MRATLLALTLAAAMVSAEQRRTQITAAEQTLDSKFEIGTRDNRGYTVASSYKETTVDQIQKVTLTQRIVNWSRDAADMNWISGDLAPGIVNARDKYEHTIVYDKSLGVDVVSFDVANIPLLGLHSLVITPSGAGSFYIDQAPSYLPRIRAAKVALAQVLPAIKMWQVVSKFASAAGEIRLTAWVSKEDSANDYAYYQEVENHSNRTVYLIWASTANTTFPSGIDFTVEPGGRSKAVFYGAEPLLITDVSVITNTKELLSQIKMEFLRDDPDYSKRLTHAAGAGQKQSGIVDLKNKMGAKITIIGTPAFVPSDFQIKNFGRLAT